MVAVTAAGLVAALTDDYVPAAGQHAHYIALGALSLACSVGYVLAGWFLYPRR